MGAINPQMAWLGFFKATNFSSHLMPQHGEREKEREKDEKPSLKMKKRLSLVIRTQVNRVAPDWDLSEALPTELWRHGGLEKNLHWMY